MDSSIEIFQPIQDEFQREDFDGNRTKGLMGWASGCGSTIVIIEKLNKSSR